DTGENHQPTLRKNTAEPVEQTLKQNTAGVEPGLLAASLAMALLLMAFGALATLGGALLLRLLSGIRIMTAISQAAAATFFILLMPAGVCRLIARIRGWDPDPDPTERN
ncbi:hypothetical protein, partial [Bifidobacterium longum]|uniref:hypothetical protein n=3 Tax=Bifidobacterium longum TaxID=216816 RepID=UPI0032BFEEF6